MGKKFKPESQLSKHGWKTGAGLGKEEDGIKEAVKVKLKFDQAGIGHDVSEQFTYHWWDHVFNKAANSITVDESESEVKMKTSGECQISSKKNSVINTMNKNTLMYGTFVKASTLTDGVEEKAASTDDSDSDSDSDEDIGTASKLTDEQLMKVCGGRTAHKAARHGLGLNGKLARIAEQEKMYLSDKPAAGTNGSSKASTEEVNSTEDDPEATVKIRKDKKKDKAKKRRKEKSDSYNIGENCDVNEEVTTKKKKKRKYKDVDRDSTEFCAAINNDELDDDSVGKKKKKSRKSDQIGSSTELDPSQKSKHESDCGVQSDCDTTINKNRKEKKSKKKKKSHK